MADRRWQRRRRSSRHPPSAIVHPRIGTMTTPAASAAPIQRQISLPLSKAVEIAWQNIRLRLSRSLLVTSGIVLALAFLMAILTSDAVVRSMRAWSQRTIAGGPSSAGLVEAQKLQ